MGQPLAQPAVALMAAPVQALSPPAVTQIFGNTTPITINDNATATPYPATITVSGVTVNTVTRVSVGLSQFTHTFPDDVDVILVGPQGQRAILMSDAGGGVAVTGIDLTFSPTAATPIPDATTLATGTFRPANYGTGTDLSDTFPAPFPAPNMLTNEPADLSVFNLTNPNGDWKLYVVDDNAGQDIGQTAGGWTLSLTVPTVFTVNSAADTSDGACTTTTNGCTLREALALAGDGDLINFAPTIFNTPQTIYLTAALPDIATSVTLQGPGANLLTVRRAFDATTNFRIFNIPGGGLNVAISGLTITGGISNAEGGGISSASNLTLTRVAVSGNQGNVGGGVDLSFADGTFTNSTFSGNTASSGGGIYFASGSGHKLRLINSTVSGNIVDGGGVGGGIINLSNSGSSTLEVISSTITDNTATNSGGILNRAFPGTVATTTLRNSIIANNTLPNLAKTGSGTVASNGFNLASDDGGGFLNLTLGDKIGQNPLLGPLSLGGGQTPTHALLGGSPALDAGDSSGLSSDQRGVARAFDTPGSPNVSDFADIGAVEMQSVIVTNANDSDAGSLRQAINDASPNSDILFDPVFFNVARTITLTSGQLVIDRDLTINGTGANRLTVSGGGIRRVFKINAGSNVSLSGMRITRGNGIGSFDNLGGGIFSLGNLTISASTITGNSVATGGYGGGGIYSQGNLTISDSTISGNTAAVNGGGIVAAFGTFNLVRSTVSGNTAVFRGGGLNVLNANATLTNSTISGNTANDASSAGGGVFLISIRDSFTLQVTNCTIANNNAPVNAGSGILTLGQSATATATTLLRNTIIANNSAPNLLKTEVGGGTPVIISQGFNLANDDSTLFLNQPTDKNNAFAGLAALADNGGATQTHALFGGSAALDAGHNAGSGVFTDQRGAGFARTVDLAAITNPTGSDGTDIGAYEAPTAPPPAFIFSASNYNIGEAAARATIFVLRTGDTATSATVDYRTQDADTFTVGCADTVNNQGGAYGRCDFATAVGTLTFAAGQTQQQFTVPVIDDVHVEGFETFAVQLGNAVGATLGTPSTASITIIDNDPAGQPNPVYEPNPANTSRTIPFFVRQQYLDFLSREPEAGEPWTGVLNRCLTLPGGDPQNINNLNPNSPSAGCDRILVSLSFFGSPEFQLKGFYVFRFYKLAYNRLPEYLEIIPDMSFVAGQTPAEVFARKAQLATLFTARAEFVTTYGSLTHAQYVNALLARYQLSQITTPDPANPDGTVKVTLTSADLTNRLNAGTLTRAQVFRAVADSEQSNTAEFNNAFVGMQYYGYLRRKPEPAGYQSWLTVLQRGDQRTMVNGFLNSVEYRLRFSRP